MIYHSEVEVLSSTSKIVATLFNTVAIGMDAAVIH
jgi:hypothetical protein